MPYLFIIALVIFSFLYLSIYVDLAYFFGLTGAILFFFLITVRLYYLKVIKLLEIDKKPLSKKESADDHPIIKSARARLK